MAEKKKWIQGAIKHPGALKAKAKKAGALNKEGNIKKGWEAKQAKKGGQTGKQAQLAETLGHMNKGGKKKSK